MPTTATHRVLTVLYTNGEEELWKEANMLKRYSSQFRETKTIEEIILLIKAGKFSPTSSSGRRTVTHVKLERNIFLITPASPGDEIKAIFAAGNTTVKIAAAAAPNLTGGKPPRIPKFKQRCPPPLPNKSEDFKACSRASPTTPPPHHLLPQAAMMEQLLPFFSLFLPDVYILYSKQNIFYYSF